ncbi:DUF6455 family protein [Pseudorhodobacter sp. MZDSW-24AT]|uniref:DUF6455 family protein n=1 Tax=Pseudorhodobacter sp. MZDSW-24AT TaxID=2052957 RepID=UPI001E574FC8|nr:DUF6455 family protein [Pseudorhodobacter sp. MZDSW-24AT]
MAMIGYAESPLAWGLTRGMARLLGVNLPSAVVEGWLTRRELGQLVARCEACGQKSACTAWLAIAAGTPCLPVFCPNKSALEVLSLRH